MNDANDDGPAPDALNYPETLRLTIATGGDAFDDAIEAAAAAEDGDQTAAVVSFEEIDGIRKLLTARRLELLRSLMGAPAESISGLADRLGRSYSVVHEDVEVLAEYGIIRFRRVGQAKQPFVPYERIEFDVTVEAPREVDDSEAPA